MAEIFNQYDVDIQMLVLQNIQGSGGEINLLTTDAFLSLTIYEDMFAPSLSGRILLKDVFDWGSLLPLSGEEILWMDIGSVDTSGGSRLVEIPPMYVYGLHQIESDEQVHGKQWVLDFSSWTHVVGNWDESHLTGLLSEESGQEENEKYFMGPISELAQKVMDNNTAFTDGWGSGDHDPLVDETGNNIYYKPNQGHYGVIRKSTEQRPLELLTQLAENSIDVENPNAANFVFYQDLDRWNFKSIDKMIRDGNEVKTLYGGVADGESDSRSRIVSHSVKRQTNNFDAAQNGMFASTMSFYIPKPKDQDAFLSLSGKMKTYFYKVNCRYKDHFPAAIVGFEQIEDHKAQWRYAFAEVYLVFNYESRKPTFKIKPLEHGGIRSWITYKEDGPHYINATYSSNETPAGADFWDWFGRPAFNTMESGNDGFIGATTRQGWEAPGYRLDTKLWEKSCMRIQPVRGSFPWGYQGNGDSGEELGLNNVKKNYPPSETLVSDDFDANENYPIVDMKIYYDQDGEAQFFFSAENAVDGECREDENGDCQDIPESGG